MLVVVAVRCRRYVVTNVVGERNMKSEMCEIVDVKLLKQVVVVDHRLYRSFPFRYVNRFVNFLFKFKSLVTRSNRSAVLVLQNYALNIKNNIKIKIKCRQLNRFLAHHRWTNDSKNSKYKSPILNNKHDILRRRWRSTTSCRLL